MSRAGDDIVMGKDVNDKSGGRQGEPYTAAYREERKTGPRVGRESDEKGDATGNPMVGTVRC